MKKTLLAAALSSALFCVSGPAFAADTASEPAENSSVTASGSVLPEAELKASDTGTVELADTVVSPEYIEIERLRNTKEIIVVNKEQIQEQGNRTVSDVLSKIPSISVNATGQGQIDIRGQGSDQAARNIQVLLDGAPITTLVSHPMQTNYDVIPVEQLERIDIIPGGGSVMYGSGASGGIVNLTSSLNSMNNPETSIYGEWNSKGYRAGATAGTTFADGRGAVEFTGSKLNRDLEFVDTFRNSKYYSAGLRWNFTPNQRVILRASRLEERSEYLNNVSRYKLKAYGTDYRPSPRKVVSGVDSEGNRLYRMDSGYIYGNRDLDTISLSYSANLSDKWQMSHDVFYNTGNYQGNNDSERTMDHDGYGIRSKLNWKYANWGELLFGLDAIRQEANLDYNDYERIKGTKYRAVPMSFDYQKDIYGLYLLNTIKYGKWEFNQGIREELTRWWLSKTGKATSENGTDTSRRWNTALELSGAYHYSDTGRFYGRYERGYTTPDGIEIADTIRQADGTRLIKESSVNDEVHNMYEIGWRDAFKWTTSSVTLWYSSTDDQIARNYQRGEYGLNYLSVNLLDTRRWGADISFSQKVGPFTFEETYAYLKGRTRCASASACERLGEDNDYTSKGLQKVPKHKLILRAMWDVRDDLTLELQHIKQGRYTNFTRTSDEQDQGFFKGHDLTNFSVRYHPNRHLSVYAGVTNLFNTKYYDYGSGNGYYSTVVPGAERQFFVGMKATY